jgi:flagellum-specific peptidoglycan hydrolase FlgJ
MKKLLLITVLLVPFLLASAQKNTPKSYIEQFKDDAIRIMHETGVPASIVLGVAMHESACGNSSVAHHLNNQFGVRCNTKIVYIKNNRKIHTDYKKYESVYDSFQDFARIMTERTAFSDLATSLSHFDYQGWVHGIQKNGYAHDPKWGKDVLGIINKYQLYVFDEAPAEGDQPEPQQLLQPQQTAQNQ